MSKLSPLGQSMASLFTPESERLARAQKTKETSQTPSANGLKIPGMPKIQSDKPGDSLGNPNSPGYEPWGKKKHAESGAQEKQGEKAPGGTVIETAAQGPEIIRLSSGWEKLLLAQKKLCEKAKNLFTSQEGPDNYSKQRKSKILSFKSRGCIVDLDVQETQDQQKEAEARLKEQKKESA